MTQAYPLAWPEGFPRSARQESSRFKTTLAGALKNVQTSLRLFGQDSGKPVANIVLSSNVTLGAERPSDPGVAVYFVWHGLQVCIPVDRYDKVQDNLQAIHHIIEARRTELRHGSLHLVRASFTGFLALPPSSNGHWSSVLGIPADSSPVDIEQAYRQAAKKGHPDAGGSHERMAAINAAREVALKERSH